MNLTNPLKRWAFLAVASLSIGGFQCKSPQPADEKPGNNYARIDSTDTEADIIRKAANVVPSDRQFRWQQLELTAFIHFGVNTFTNKEWGDGTESPEIFNPTSLDADQWAQICKAAGVKLMILTAKHHDGFCLWPSKFTEHSVKNSPWKNGQGDVVKEAVDACRRVGIGFGVYLSPWDRNSPYFGDSAKYNDYFINQLTELLTQYGKIDEVWFDGANGEGPNGKQQVYDFDRWYNHIRELQPDAIIAVMGPDVRWVGTETGYGRDTEWSVVPVDEQQQDKIAQNSQQNVSFTPKNMMDDDLGSRDKIFKARSLVWYPAETDVSIRPGWFYHREEDDQVKSPEKLLDIYFNSVGKNGVLLLNIPPDKRGKIHQNDSLSLIQWKSLLDETFSVNLLKGSKVSVSSGKFSSGNDASGMTDGAYSSYWIADESDTTAVIEFQLSEKIKFDVLMLQEYIKKGQRIESFVLEYNDGDNWKEIVGGTTVGYKRLLRFDEVDANRIRLRITASRLNPTIAEIGLYRYPVTSK
ncbi:MAG TPA: alpha-L-fucosidase [Parasegetibacter sp.]